MDIAWVFHGNTNDSQHRFCMHAVTTEQSQEDEMSDGSDETTTVKKSKIRVRNQKESSKVILPPSPSKSTDHNEGGTQMLIILQLN